MIFFIEFRGYIITYASECFSFCSVQRFLGDYSQSLLTGEAVQGAISRFQASLQLISDVIKLRNSNVKFPYKCLLPERVPNSITF